MPKCLITCHSHYIFGHFSCICNTYIFNESVHITTLLALCQYISCSLLIPSAKACSGGVYNVFIVMLGSPTLLQLVTILYLFIINDYLLCLQLKNYFIPKFLSLRQFLTYMVCKIVTVDLFILHEWAQELPCITHA